SRRRAAVTEVQAARDSVDNADADERSARVALGDEEAHLAELQRAESTARAELQQLRIEHERAAHAASQRSDEQVRASARAEATRAELAAARLERNAFAANLRALDGRVTALGENAAL